MCYSKTISSIDWRTNERATHTAGGGDTDSFVSARVGDGSLISDSGSAVVAELQKKWHHDGPG